MSRLNDWLKLLAVTAFVVGTTSYVWVKVQIAETALSLADRRNASEELREERSKLRAAVDLAQRPGVVRTRAARELGLVAPTHATFTRLVVSTAE
jgi:hypothetical protein